MSIEQFKVDMIESIEKRLASGVVLMSKKSYVEWTCAECAITMLYREKFNHHSIKSYVNFEYILETVKSKYGVPLAPFINAFDDEHVVEGWSTGLDGSMYKFGKEIRVRFNPVPYEEICGTFLATFKNRK